MGSPLLRRILRFAGLTAFALAWITILLSAWRNPWFDFLRHALSDLGGPRAIDPWIYNAGLMVAGAVTSLYAAYLAAASRSKLSVYASAFIFVAGIFLALIGVFPAGTRPHVFVSTWFFVQMWMAMLASTADLLAGGRKVLGLLLLALCAVGPAGALLVRWPSVAVLEIYGIALIGVYVLVLTKCY